MKKIVIAGGTGFLGQSIINLFSDRDAHFTILSREKHPDSGNVHYEKWDGINPGSWTQSLECADVVINLNGKSVDCRYNERNKALIYSTRIDSTKAIGKAILACKHPPALWINSGSATIYRHSLDKEMDESGELGAGFSVDVCQKWEAMFNVFTLPHTRKVIIRTGIVLGKNGGPFIPLLNLVRMMMGGRQGDGRQYCSWLHEVDFVRAIEFIINTPFIQGTYNLTSPNPISNSAFMKVFRNSVNRRFGIPLSRLVLEFGALLIGTETELILKSRRVVPQKLLEAGFRFKFAHLDAAVKDITQNSHP